MLKRELTKLRKKYPLLDLGLDNQRGVIVVYGGNPDVNFKSAHQQYNRLAADSSASKYLREYPDHSSLTDRVQTQVAKPEVRTKSWPLPGASAGAATDPLAAVEKPSASIAVTMPNRGGRSHRRRGARRGRPTPRSRSYRISNAALRPTKHSFRQVFEVQMTQGYWDHQFKMSELVPEYLHVYEEMRILHFTAVLLTKDVSVTAGIYTAILLDQNGYGSALKSTSTWFKRVADMRGSVVHHAIRGFRLSWKATEPDARNFIKVIDGAINDTIARIYVIGQDITVNMSGVLLVRGQCLCRGQYYDANKLAIEAIKNLRIKEIAEETEDREDSESSSYVVA